MRLLAIAGVAGAFLRNGLIGTARAAQAVIWPTAAFAQKTEPAALKAFYDGRTPEPSYKITLDAPEIAENGAVVPVSVTTTLTGVTSIAFMVPDNPFTLTAAYAVPEGTMPQVSCRLKMAKTAKIIAIVDAGGKLYSAEREVKVTLGGCG